MESKVIFRDYQEQQAQDHNDLQDFSERSFDHLVLDAVTAERRYAGFNVVKTGQAEVQISPGRMYDILGAIYALNTTTTQSMVSYLAALNTRYLLLTATGTDVETDVEERDYLVDVTSGATEPRAVATTRSRVAVLSFTNGVESADPIKPAIPVGHVAIAYILLDTTQIISIEMLPDNRITSTDSLDLRADALELFMSIIGPRVDALAADLADLRNRINALSTIHGLQNLAMDVARLKSTLKYPPSASDYDTDWFLDEQDSDINNALTLGYMARVEEGLRFADENADTFEITLFSANDPNASYANGVLLPKYTEILRLATATKPGEKFEDLGIAQYGFQTVEMKQGYMSRSRLRYGGSFLLCSNSMQWNVNDTYGSIWQSSDTYFQPASQLYVDGTVSTRMRVMGAQWYNPLDMRTEVTRYDDYWLDEWQEPFMYAVTVDHVLNGAFVAQSFLVPNDIWATSVQIYISQKGGNADIQVAFTEMLAGVPNKERCFMKTVHAAANIKVGWNKIPIPATFMRKGQKYALVLISNANHQIGMVSGQKYLDGTFFYSTDGIYYQGDLTKDLMMQVWGCKFNNAMCVIEFGAINLDAGFRFIDILAEMWVPDSAAIYWELQLEGTGEWIPLIRDNASVALATAPILSRFRARFDGTVDMQGAITLQGSRVKISRPRQVFHHVSTPITLATACTTIVCSVTLEGFDEVPHDHTLVLKTGATLSVDEAPDTTVTKLLDLSRKAYSRTYTFSGLSPAVTKFIIIQHGTTTSAQSCFHVAERTFYGS